MDKYKIALIEDDEVQVKFLIGGLRDGGFEVIHASNGEQGLKLIQSEKPDLVLLDIIMPEMDGLTMLKQLREKEWGKNIPVLVLTNLSDSRSVAEAIEKGAYGFLQKTQWTIEDVVKKIKEKLSVVSGI